MCTLNVYIAGEIDLLENLDIVHITLLVVLYGVARLKPLCELSAKVKCQKTAGKLTFGDPFLGSGVERFTRSTIHLK
jgi:hypothetical protein